MLLKLVLQIIKGIDAFAVELIFFIAINFAFTWDSRVAQTQCRFFRSFLFVLFLALTFPPHPRFAMVRFHDKLSESVIFRRACNLIEFALRLVQHEVCDGIYDSAYELLKYNF